MAGGKLAAGLRLSGSKVFSNGGYLGGDGFGIGDEGAELPSFAGFKDVFVILGGAEFDLVLVEQIQGEPDPETLVVRVVVESPDGINQAAAFGFFKLDIADFEIAQRL